MNDKDPFVDEKDPFEESSRPTQAPSGGPLGGFGTQEKFSQVPPDLPPELASLPEIGSITTTEGWDDIRGHWADFKIAWGLLSSTDAAQKIDIIKAAVPEAEILQHDDGVTEVAFPNGQRAILNKPGLSEQDVIKMGFDLLAFLPAERFARGGTTLLGKMGLGAAGGGATSFGLDITSGLLGSEQGIQTDEILINAGIGGAIPLFGRWLRMRQSKSGKIPDDQIEAIDEAGEITSRTGVDLFPAQVTKNPALLEKQAFVAQLPSGAQIAQRALTRQNEQAGTAVMNYLDTLADARALRTGSKKIRNASQQAIEGRRAARKEAASPLYDAALDGHSDFIDATPILNQIDTELRGALRGGKVFKSITEAEDLVKTAISEGTLRGFHVAKTEIDALISAATKKGLGPTVKGRLTRIKNALMETLENVSPEYKKAAEKWREMSPDVEKITDSVIGDIAELQDKRLKQVATKLFDPTETNPSIIGDAKRVIQEVDPDAWSEILRTEFERRLGNMRALSGAVPNEPAALKAALFGNMKQRRVLFAALDGEQLANAKWLEQSLERAAMGRGSGSQTAARETIKDELRGGFWANLRNWIRHPIDKTIGIGEDALLDKRVRQMAEALYDPGISSEVAKVRKLVKAGKHKEAWLSWTQIFSRGEEG